MKAVRKKIVVCLGIIIAFAIAVSIPASEVDQAGIKSVQTILNYWGYDCGTPDGIAGGQTQAAVKQYQYDQEIEETGEITVSLANRMTAGVPWNVFEKRYNQAVDYWNSHTDMTSAPTVEHFRFYTNVEDYSPNNNLTLSINPNYNDKKMVGLINLGKSNGFDSETAMVEVFCTFYAFDQWMENPLDAIDTYDGLFKPEGEGCLSIDGIEYTNYSVTGMLLIKGQYENFDQSPITTGEVTETVPDESADTVQHDIYCAAAGLDKDWRLELRHLKSNNRGDYLEGTGEEQILYGSGIYHMDGDKVIVETSSHDSPTTYTLTDNQYLIRDDRKSLGEVPQGDTFDLELKDEWSYESFLNGDTIYRSNIYEFKSDGTFIFTYKSSDSEDVVDKGTYKYDDTTEYRVLVCEAKEYIRWFVVIDNNLYSESAVYKKE